MPVGPSRDRVDMLEHVVGGDDVQHGERAHDLGMIERHPVRGPRASVMADDMEALEAELAHHVNLVLRHPTEAVVGQILTLDGLLRVAVPAKVGAHHGVLAGEQRRDARPHRQVLRVAMQQGRRPRR